MTKTRIVVIGVILLVSACCVSGNFYDALEKGEGVPQGKVLLIGKLTVEPMVEQGNVIVQAQRGTHKGVIKMNFGDNADQPLDKDALVPFSSTEQMDFNFKKTSFIPLDPGTRFARWVPDARFFEVHLRRQPVERLLRRRRHHLYHATRREIVVPQKAKAVYIGTIIYQHDLKSTNPTARISVRSGSWCATSTTRRCRTSRP
jgi:hypothetical protein